jgi:hypothetical protein
LLPPVDGIGHNFVWRQHVTVRHEQDEFQFEALLQKDGDELTFIGLLPAGTKLFVLRQIGRVVSVAQKQIDVDRALVPEAILFDIHRAYFLGFEPGKSETWNGKTSSGLTLSETWESGSLIHRVIADHPDAAEPHLEIDYQPGYRLGEAPGNVQLTHSSGAYAISVKTLEVHVL